MSYRNVFTKHGWKKTATTSEDSIYEHPKVRGEIVVDRGHPREWSHGADSYNGNGYDSFSGGKNHKDLDSYLTNLHRRIKENTHMTGKEIDEGAISGAILGAAAAGKGHRIAGAIAGAAIGHIAKKEMQNPEFKSKVAKGLGHAASLAGRFAEEREEAVQAIVDAAVDDNAAVMNDLASAEIRARVMEKIEELRPTVFTAQEEAPSEEAKEVTTEE